MNSFAEELVSRWKLDLLDELKSNRGYQFTIRELSENTSGSYGSVRDFIHCLSDWGVVSVVKKGGSLLVSYNAENEYIDLINILLKTESDYLKNLSEDYVDKLVDDFSDVEKVVLYGSVARGEATLNSDIDLLVLGSVSEEDVRQHAHENSDKATISPIVESSESFKQGLEEGRAWEKQVKKDGITLYCEN